MNTTLTTSTLNALENSFTAHGLGLEIINESELTYNKITTAIANGYLPILKFIYNDGTCFYPFSRYYIENTIYYVYFGSNTYTAASASAVMTSDGASGGAMI